jgi:hypothetical protein
MAYTGQDGLIYTGQPGIRRGAGVVDRDGLENRCTRKGTEGSNPSLSA